MEDNFHGFISRNIKIRQMNIAITGQKITIISSDQLLEEISFKVDNRLHLEKENAV